MYTIRKQFKFEGAHVLTSSYAVECQRLHGHSYIVEVLIKAEKLNTDGMVLDFKRLNEIMAPKMAEWDHRTMVQDMTGCHAETLGLSRNQFVLVGFNPTAENMARYLHKWLGVAMQTEGLLDRTPLRWAIRIHETRTGWAQYDEGGF